MTQTLPLFKNTKERRVFFLFLFFIFIANTYFKYNTYTHFIQNEIFVTEAQVLNIYPKKDFTILKVETKDFTFFTSTNNITNHQLFDTIEISLLTQNIDFISYLKGFYTKSFSIYQLNTESSMKKSLYDLIYTQHKTTAISSLYAALFLATPLDIEMRSFASNYGVSHLIAISGFHLGVMSLVLYFILHTLYSKLHQNFFPYRNKRFDIMVVISFVLFFYLLFLNLPASLLRAFIMFLVALFLLRHNIKLLSFETLFIITCIIIALFPSLLFSLSLWFSICGVFYIFLFLHYFKNLNKYLQIVLFNFWIYFAMNPITHYFFETTTYEQLFSPLLTLLFTLFYPLSAILHLLGIGDSLDAYLVYFLQSDIRSVGVLTPYWVFMLYVVVSLFSSIKKEIFVLLNISFIVFNFYLYSYLFI